MSNAVVATVDISHYVRFGTSVHPCAIRSAFTSPAIRSRGASPTLDKRDSTSWSSWSTRNSRPKSVSPDRDCIQIQFLLGHVSIQTTERYLGCKQRLRAAVNDRLGIEPDGRVTSTVARADGSIRPRRPHGTNLPHACPRDVCPGWHSLTINYSIVVRDNS
jgi:hypothetical protein